MADKVFRDPLYNYIRIDRGPDAWLLKVLDSPEVQRLRRIHQLGVSNFTYPGADHNRLAHSLGVLHLMQLVVEHLQKADTRAQDGAARDALLAAALVHDVGHGPFSHLFEPCLGIKHEKWSIAAVLDESSGLHKALALRNKYLPKHVAELIDEHNHDHPSWQKALLSSQLDVDRLDYLRRDSLCTGAGYGHFDWFGPVPGSDPPTFVIAAFTTAATKKLHQKWLANPTPGFSDADTGDFLKAVHKAEAIRATIPHARFVIYLCTNRVVEPALQTAVRAAAVRHEVEVRFLGQTRLRDALDTRGDGQYLRHKHLGIRAERLSAFLLQELGCKSLAEYAKDFLITPPSSFVCTESSKGVSAALGETGVRLVMAVGRSGAGKSVAAFQALAQHLSRDGFGLHIPETVAEHASSIEDAILQTLRIHEPGLDANSGIDALRFGW